ncbi:hypothetical protein ACOSQ2_007976 [Xanthoceras sorbifolium]|uniref:Bifunctional inhibitor/plant lipid transfer protein/seed storage helical domain-containing protein n=1 Tax=Xanthoceras sorbifolium TaxID=99658 RepID=A0ABQ8IAW7_9ROSI|nr:hypothetical protein JRO89_XS03G0208100 [Xanthoceras sorbifolium]
MDLRELVSIRLTWVLVFELCVLAPIVSSQIQGCSMEGIDILQCLNQDNSSFTDNCCKTLRKVVQAGYNCLCSLLSPSIPLLSPPFSLPLSNCDVSVPSLALCRVLAPMPVVFPPTAASPKHVLPPPSPPPLLSLPPPLPSSPPHERLVPSSSTRKDNSTMVATQQPHSNENAVPGLCVNNSGNNNQSSNGKEDTKILSRKTLLLLLALQGLVLLA